MPSDLSELTGLELSARFLEVCCDDLSLVAGWGSKTRGRDVEIAKALNLDLTAQDPDTGECRWLGRVVALVRKRWPDCYIELAQDSISSGAGISIIRDNPGEEHLPNIDAGYDLECPSLARALLEAAVAAAEGEAGDA